MYSLVLLAALAPAAPEPAEPSGMPPTQMLASIDGTGKLTLTWVACNCDYPLPPEVVPPGPKGEEKAPEAPKVKVRSVTVTTAELSAKHVTAYTVDGRPVAADKLATMLAKERNVLVVLDGKKVDPILLQLYKDDTLVLVPPAHSLNVGMGGYGPLTMPATIVPVPARALPVPEIRGVPDKAPLPPPPSPFRKP
jgi:hypothetical protein